MKKYFVVQALTALLLTISMNDAAAQSAQPSKSEQKSVSVNELAGNPSAYMGSVTVIGVVGTVTAGKGFTLVDTREYRACGLSCLTEPGTKIIPVRWSGASPTVEQTVRVEGELTRKDKGLSFLARKIDKQ